MGENNKTTLSNTEDDMDNCLLAIDTTPEKDETVNVEAVAEPTNTLEGVEIEVSEASNRKRDRLMDEVHEVIEASHAPLMGLHQPKRGRGRPRGSKNKTSFDVSLARYGATPLGAEFTPCAIIIQEGEDLYDRILCVSRATPAMTILACTGTISTATISFLGAHGITLSYQLLYSRRQHLLNGNQQDLWSPCGFCYGYKINGRFEIISLKGSYTESGSGALRQRFGYLSVSLANTGGQLFGGRIAGPIIAATPLQLIIGCFNQASAKEKKRTRKSRPRALMAVGTQEGSEFVSDPEVTVAILGDNDVGCSEIPASGEEGAGFINQGEAENANIGNPEDQVYIAPSDLVSEMAADD